MPSATHAVKGMQKFKAHFHAFPLFNKVSCSVDDLARHLYNCRRQKNLDQTLQLHSHIYGIGLENNVLLGNYLVTAYVEAGFIDCAHNVFDSLALRNEQSWNSLIVGYVKFGKPHAALILYDKMLSDDNVNLNGHAIVALLKASSQLRDIERGAKLSLEIERRGFLENNCFVGSALVDMYVKHGLVFKAQELFERLLVRDVVSWNVLISGLAKCGCGNLALEIFGCMRVEGIFPNAVTFISVLKACCAIGCIQQGLDIHAEIERNGLLETDVAIGGTLVSMYARCGCLAKAQEVFDRLQAHDVVSWTALTIGYAEYQYYEKAIMCFQQMQLEGVSPDVVTLAWIVRACGNIQARGEGLNLHKFIKEKGIMETNLIIGGNLVDMYIKFGMLEKAEQLFENISVRDVNSWNSVIVGYAENGHGEKAINSYEQMKLEGISPDSITFSWVLKACAILGATENVCNLHTEIYRDSIAKTDIVIASSLIDAYMKCGLLGRAQEVFDKLLIRDVVLWNVLIMGYADNGHGEEALERFEWMQCEGITPDAVTYLSICKACGTVGSIEKGEHIHNDIERKGFLKLNLVLANVLIDMYVQCGSLEKAHQVLNNLSIRDVVSWNTIIAGYTEHGYGKDALICFEQMQHEGVSPNALTFLCSIRACTCIGDTEMGEEIYAEIRRNGLGSNTVIGTAVVNMYAKFGFLHRAQQTFDGLLVQDVTTWNALMDGYEEHGHGDKALECFEQMQHEGIPLNSVTFACILKACGNMKAVAKGKEIHAELARKGLLEGDLLVGNTLIDMYAKSGLCGYAEEVFMMLPIKDVITWTAMIAGYVECGCGEEALQCFDRMQINGIVPNSITFLCCLRACSSIGASNRGLEIHAEIERKGTLCSNIAISSALVDLYAKCGLIAVARHVFNKLPDQLPVTWNALISGYAQAGETETAFDIFEKMRKKCVKPDQVTFLVILNICSRAGLMSRYEMYFEAMSKEYGIVPTIEHQNCMVDLLVRMGEVEEAVSVSQRIPCSNLVIWHSLLDACRKWGNIKVGLEAFEQALRIDSQDAAAYVLASHIYAISGRESDQLKVKKSIKTKVRS